MSKTLYNPAAVEAEVLAFWEKQKIIEKLKAARAGRKKWYLLDGPPYINDVAHVGTIKPTFAKDIWSRLKLMQGFDVWLQPGFDTHGLPIETKVEAELNISTKSDIQKLGMDNFIAACYKKVRGNESKWMEFYRRMGALRGWFEPYITYQPHYIESGWWTVKRLHEKGFLVEGERPIHWCARCETSLAGYEVTDSYRDLQDPGIYVKFPVIGRENEFLLVYTTTPWTLFGNVAIAANPREQYAKVRINNISPPLGCGEQNELLILAKARVKAVMEELAQVNYEIVEEFPGAQLDGLRYAPVVDVPVQAGLPESARRVIMSVPAQKYKKYKKHVMGTGQKNNITPLQEHGKEKMIFLRSQECGEQRNDMMSPNDITPHLGYREQNEEFSEFVTVAEGSGLVHTAPGHGASDWEIGKHYSLPVVSPVDEQGRLTEGAGNWAGMQVKEADKSIIEHIKQRGLLFHSSTIIHSYPVCWRCKTPLIFRNSKQWFFKVSPIKDMMIEENGKVKWLPGFAGKRFHNWLIDAIDWNISQQRYWGIPLPIWVCSACGAKRVIGSAQELRASAICRLPHELDLHRHVVDNIKLRCDCGGEAKRVPDITNVWFDSGIAPWASLGYPHKNKELFEKLWPVDMIAESQDQIRGWFYSLMFMGAAAFSASPYRAVSMLGWVLDENGEKMSKSLGNVVWATDALEKLGADILRLYYAWEVAPWETQNFSFKTAEDIRRSLNILWNVVAYMNEYSAAAKWKPKKTLPRITRPEDRWLLSKTNSLIQAVTGALENFELHTAGRALVCFITEDLSRFWLKLAKERTRPGSRDRAAFAVLDYTLNRLARLLAPICPFIADSIWQELFAARERKESVHLADWPKADANRMDAALESQVEVARSVIEAAAALRSGAGIQLRYQLPMLTVSGGRESLSSVRALAKIISALANVDKVRLGAVKAKVSARPNWSSAGKKFGARVQELAAALQKADASRLRAQLQKQGRATVGSFTIAKEDVVFAEQAAANGAQFRGGTVFLDMKVTQELKHRWLVRELIRAVQEKRKQMGLRVTQKIKLSLADPVFKKAKKQIELQAGCKLSIGRPAGETGKIEFEQKVYEFGIRK